MKELADKVIDKVWEKKKDKSKDASEEKGQKELDSNVKENQDKSEAVVTDGLEDLSDVVSLSDDRDQELEVDSKEKVDEDFVEKEEDSIHEQEGNRDGIENNPEMTTDLETECAESEVSGTNTEDNMQCSGQNQNVMHEDASKEFASLLDKHSEQTNKTVEENDFIYIDIETENIVVETLLEETVNEKENTEILEKERFDSGRNDRNVGCECQIREQILEPEEPENTAEENQNEHKPDREIDNALAAVSELLKACFPLTVSLEGPKSKELSDNVMQKKKHRHKIKTKSSDTKAKILESDNWKKHLDEKENFLAEEVLPEMKRLKHGLKPQCVRKRAGKDGYKKYRCYNRFIRPARRQNDKQCK